MELHRRDFHDSLYEWLERVPWFLVSLAFHLVLFFILMALPWRRSKEAAPHDVLVLVEGRIDHLFESEHEEVGELVAEEPEEPELIEEPEPEPEPEPRAAVVSAPFDSTFDADLAALGNAAGGKMGERLAPRGASGGPTTAQVAVELGLEWLQAHQDPRGFWDADGFTRRCGKVGAGRCKGTGDNDHDVGLTGLALLAFLGDGHTTASGAHREVVERGVEWLLARHDPSTGRIGSRSGHSFVYDHAIATLALCEAYYFVPSPRVRRVAQGAVDYIQAARNPGAAWRYSVPPNGQNDTSVTGWMVFALTAAREAGLRVEDQAFGAAIGFFNDMTDPDSGRVGYRARGGPSGRGVWNRRFPTDDVETLTAVGLLCRIFIADSRGWDLSRDPMLGRHADLLLGALPKWDERRGLCDMYYWYHGSYAMYQMGGRYWDTWRDAMEKVVVRSQERSGDERGSWDPVGPWGSVGGRVYSTAMMTLCMEVYYRYGRLLGTR